MPPAAPTLGTRGEVASGGQMRRFRHAPSLLGALALTLAVPAIAQEEPGDPPARVARVNLVEGNVSLAPAGSDQWVSDVINRPLAPGDRLWVDRDARAELHFGSTALRLGSNSGIEVVALGDSGAELKLSAGTLIVHLRELDANDSFALDTPAGVVNLEQAGLYRLDVADGSDHLAVAVQRGGATLHSNAQSFPVQDHQQGAFSGSELITAETGPLPAPDALDRWSAERDRREDGVPGVRYVSRDMTGYEDLDAYGSWQSDPSYGTVWQPTVGADWAPYQDGHWDWIAPWGWTWIDAQPWGFAPFHYGRWVYLGQRWGWCPGPRGPRPVYAPALVAFVGGAQLSLGLRFGFGSSVAWFPLGWNEVYVPAYHASPTYFRRLNVSNTFVSNAYINNTYINNNYINQTPAGTSSAPRFANARVPGAITAMSQQAFASSTRIAGNAVKLPASGVTGAEVTHGAPAIAPTAQSLGPARAPPPAAAAFAFARPGYTRTVPVARVPIGEEARRVAANGGRPLPVSALAGPPREARVPPAASVPPLRFTSPAAARPGPASGTRIYQPRAYADRPPYAGAAATRSAPVSEPRATQPSAGAAPERGGYDFAAPHTSARTLPEPAPRPRSEPQHVERLVPPERHASSAVSRARPANERTTHR
jgi:hypothetical protein